MFIPSNKLRMILSADTKHIMNPDKKNNTNLEIKSLPITKFQLHNRWSSPLDTPFIKCQCNDKILRNLPALVTKDQSITLKPLRIPVQG